MKIILKRAREDIDLTILKNFKRIYKTLMREK